MLNALKYIGTFIFGAGAGTGVTWIIVRNKYKKMAEREIELNESIIRRIEKRFEKEREEKEEKKEKKDDHKTYSTLNSIYEAKPVKDKTDYSKYSESSRIEYISDDVFDTNDEYDTLCYTYYADGKMADEMEKQVINFEDDIGYEWKKHIGEYENDTVFVRNNKLKIDYRIDVEAEMTYAELLEEKPYLKGVLKEE